MKQKIVKTPTVKCYDEQAIFSRADDETKQYILSLKSVIETYKVLTNTAVKKLKEQNKEQK